jgi:hypothetical protein
MVAAAQMRLCSPDNLLDTLVAARPVQHTSG